MAKKKKKRNNSDKGPNSSRTRIGTRIIEDVFADEISLYKPRVGIDYEETLGLLWAANTDIFELLQKATSLETARDTLLTYLERAERSVFDVDNDLHILEKANVRECIRVFKSILGPINERRTGFSALKALWKLAQHKRGELDDDVSVGFLMEFICLFRGVAGHAHIYIEDEGVKRDIPEFLKRKGQEAAKLRMVALDDLGMTIQKYFKKYPSGLEEEVIGRRKDNKTRILEYFGGTDEDWNDHVWHLRHIIRKPKPLIDLIDLSIEQKEAVEKAIQYKIPFGITPYYLSLMDTNRAIGYDHAIRAQVIPPNEYVKRMAEHRLERCAVFDFMGEADTSPVNLVTRRYPCIAIIKPYNTCAQICVYCQRNWEIDACLDPKALAPRRAINEALDWLDEHPSVGDVLITGGDPLVMKDEHIRHILKALAAKEHVFRIRIGTRTPVVLPMRWTKKLIRMLKSFHKLPRLEITIVTHFEHSYEITPDAMDAVQRIRNEGISIYNQEVFTFENSRRFETAKLRRDLKSIGVDPYYTFASKGKEETRDYMVPLARILQERKEEARLLPGLDRTDEPVFNVPRLGKNHLRAWQDHRVVMILPDGSRVYEFHPWEKNITPVPPYNYVDVPIADYLERLAARGEDIRDYRTIWYYF